MSPAFPAVDAGEVNVDFFADFNGVTGIDDRFERVIEEFDENAVDFVVENYCAKLLAD